MSRSSLLKKEQVQTALQAYYMVFITTADNTYIVPQLQRIRPPFIHGWIEKRFPNKNPNIEFSVFLFTGIYKTNGVINLEFKNCHSIPLICTKVKPPTSQTIVRSVLPMSSDAVAGLVFAVAASAPQRKPLHSASYKQLGYSKKGKSMKSNSFYIQIRGSTRSYYG